MVRTRYLSGNNNNISRIIPKHPNAYETRKRIKINDPGGKTGSKTLS